MLLIELQVSYPQVFFLRFAKVVLRFQTSAHFLAPGDVLMSGHPATVRHRINGIDNDPAIREFLDDGGWNGGISNALPDVFVGL